MSFKSLKDDREHKKEIILSKRKAGKRRSNSAPSLPTSEKRDINAKDVKGRTSLFYAAKYGEIELVRHLLSLGADPDIPDNCSSYPLHEAVDGAHLDVVKLLLKYDCNVNCRNLSGQTPLMRTVMFDDLEATQVLLRSEAFIDLTDYTGKSALLVGLQEGHDKICNYLIKTGCDVNIVDHLGQSALFLALHRPSSPASVSLCQKLFRAGYDPDIDSEWLSKDLHKMFTRCGTTLLSRMMYKIGIKKSKISFRDVGGDYSDDYLEVMHDEIADEIYEREL